MASKLEIEVPDSLSSIKLEQYMEWMKVVEANKDIPDKDKSDFLDKALVEIFCKVTQQDISRIKVTEFDKILSVLSEAFSQETKELVRTFSMNGIEYGFMPNLQEMITSEYIDSESGLTGWDNINVAMAALYRPITAKRVTRGIEQYEIEEYHPSDSKIEAMLEMPLDAVLSAKVFFCDLGMELSQIFLAYLDQQKSKDIHQKKTLEESGDGINQFILSLKEMRYDLMKLPLYRYTKR